MELTQYPLVQTKTILPALRSNLVERPVLMARVLESSYPVLLLVCAPAGYGKSTFLSEYARIRQDQGWKVAWYAIDEEDDRQHTFGEYLFQSINTTLGTVPGLTQANRMLRGAAGADLLAMIPALINALSSDGRPLLIILDDFHLVKSEEILDAVALLIEHAPRNIRLAIGTRSEPGLPLSRFRARGQLIDITAGDLGFDLDEAARFLNGTMRLNLSDEQVRSLREKTEGWVAGLQLAAISPVKSGWTGIPQTEISGGHRLLAEYLLSEVFNDLSEEMQLFLVKTSTLERICAPLCAAVVGTDCDSEAVFAELDRKNLFLIGLDEKREWFRYHHLFRDFLQERLAKTNIEENRNLHQAASRWLADNGYLREAAGHAFASGDWDFAAEFVETHCFSLIIHSEIATLSEWLSRFPDEILRRHPLLCVYQCWGWVFSFKIDNLERIEGRLRLARELGQQQGNARISMEIEESARVIRQMMAMAPNPDADPLQALRESEDLLHLYQVEDASQFSFLLNIGYARMALNDLSQARSSLVKARHIAGKARLFFGIVETTFHLARISCALGNFSKGLAAITEAEREIAQSMPEPQKMLPGIGGLDIAAGCIFLEQGKFDEAESRLVKGLDLVGWGMNQHYVLVGSMALFQLYETAGRTDDADARLAYLAGMWPDISFLTDGLDLLARLHRNRQNQYLRKEAQAWCEDMRPELVDRGKMSGMGPFGACEAYFEASLAWLEINAILGNGSEIQPTLESLSLTARAEGLKTRAARLDKLCEFIQKATLVGCQFSSSVNESLIQPLSEREKEVLSLIARGASNQEIADHFVISVGTVKSHVNHILAKLDVKSRTQAAARGRELGLLG